MNSIAVSAPTRGGTSCVPPQPGTIPSRHAGQAKWRTPVEIVRASQWSASSTPPPRQAPLIAATVGYGRAWMRPKSSWPVLLPPRASSGTARKENSSRSAPAEKKYGLPVITSAAQSPPSSSPRTCSSDSNADRPKTVGFVWSAPLSIVTSASGRSSSGLATGASLNWVGGLDTLPQERGAHAHPDAKSRQPVAGTRALAHRVRELRDQPHARGRKRVAAGDRASVWVQPPIVRRDSHALTPRQYLHGERLVELEGIDLVDAQPGLLERLSRRRHRPDAHQLRLDTGEGERDEPELRLEPELLGRALGGEQGDGRPVGETRRVAGRHAAAGPERRRQVADRLEGRAGSQELVAVGLAPAFLREDAHRYDRLPHDAVLPSLGQPVVRADRIRVGVVLRQLRKPVVQV